MRLYFAYGSNMSRAQMARRCPGARALGIAELRGHAPFIMRSGYASVRLDAGGRVLGVLWNLEPRHVTALDRLEGVDVGSYRRAALPVRVPDGPTRRPLIYVGRDPGEGVAKPGYLDNIVIPAAREWGLPPDYVAGLEAWLPGGFRVRGIPPELRVSTWDEGAAAS